VSTRHVGVHDGLVPVSTRHAGVHDGLVPVSTRHAGETPWIDGPRVRDQGGRLHFWSRNFACEIARLTSRSKKIEIGRVDSWVSGAEDSRGVKLPLSRTSTRDEPMRWCATFGPADFRKEKSSDIVTKTRGKGKWVTLRPALGFLVYPAAQGSFCLRHKLLGWFLGMTPSSIEIGFVFLIDPDGCVH